MVLWGELKALSNNPLVLSLSSYQHLLKQRILFSHFLFRLALPPYLRTDNHILINPLRGSPKQDDYEHLSLPKLSTSQWWHFYSKEYCKVSATWCLGRCFSVFYIQWWNDHKTLNFKGRKLLVYMCVYTYNIFWFLFFSTHISPLWSF